MNGIFGQNKKDPKERVRELQRKLRHEINGIKRQINRMDMEEEKACCFQVKRQIKDAAKKGHKDVCLVLAKSLVQSRKTKNRMHMSCTQINSILMHMQHQVSTIRMAGAIQQSSEVMKTMQQLIKVPEIMQTMREMSKELTAAGIMEEMIEDTFEAMEPEELEEQAQEEIEKVLYEVTAGEIGKAPSAIRDDLGTSAQNERVNAEAEELISKLQSMPH
ncbi:Charged multivesicular body protein 3 [Aphelenchoides besseyi]|nr:Charged multivesicular body protein 3 [Aphelenchoides besseyi]